MPKPMPNDDRIWYNITIPYNLENAPQDTRAEYQENRTQALVENPSEYDLIISRFNIPGQTIPLFVFQIQDFPNVNINNGIYSFTLDHNGDIQQVFVQFVTNQLDIALPPAPTAAHPQQTFTRYYFVYTFQQIIDMFNTALATAFAALAAPPAGSQAPYFQYEETTQTVALITTKLGYEDTLAAANRIDIFVNTPGFRFFSALEYNFFGHNQPNGEDFQFVIHNNHNNSYQPSDQLMVDPMVTIPPFFRIPTQWNVLPNWNGIVDIIFRTGSLPVAYEWVNQYSSMGVVTPGSDNFTAILTDFLTPQNSGADARVNLQYAPQTLSRRIPLTGTTPLTKLDLQVYFKDIYGNVYPLFLAFNQEVTCKILFIKKDVVSN